MKAAPQERQNIWKEQLLKLKLFKQINDMLLKHPRMKLDAEVVQEIIIFNLPSENYEKIFETFVHWARYGNLFAYDDDAQKIFFPRKRAYKPKPKTDRKTNGKRGRRPTCPSCRCSPRGFRRSRGEGGAGPGEGAFSGIGTDARPPLQGRGTAQNQLTVHS